MAVAADRNLRQSEVIDFPALLVRILQIKPDQHEADGNYGHHAANDVQQMVIARGFRHVKDSESGQKADAPFYMGDL